MEERCTLKFHPLSKQKADLKVTSAYGQPDAASRVNVLTLENKIHSRIGLPLIE